MDCQGLSELPSSKESQRLHSQFDLEATSPSLGEEAEGGELDSGFVPTSVLTGIGVNGDVGPQWSLVRPVSEMTFVGAGGHSGLRSVSGASVTKLAYEN
jgi:hypothetical protein